MNPLAGEGIGGVALVVAACVLAAAACVMAGWWYVNRCRRENRTRELKRAVGLETAEAAHVFAAEGAAQGVLQSLLKAQMRAGIQGAGAGGWSDGDRSIALPVFVREIVKHRREQIRMQLRQAGIPEVGRAAYGRTMCRFAVIGVGLGALLGLGLGLAAACFIGMVGGCVGAAAPRWAVAKEARARAEALAEELPEMLSVCALGLRSGLSFDRSFRLYPTYFDTVFAGECRMAMDGVDVGMSSREDALMDLAGAYDSPLLERTMRGTVQALRRGTALADDLEATAEESRKQYRARREEAVARSPIRMMVPIGVLILPAMLLLVLGPVLLSLIQGL
ncbi:MAG: type II secretion system F family protein [Eggerthellaceae bacterium]|nr:type II secretion system F family protein [Eggerthellaceae bacterium]